MPRALDSDDLKMLRECADGNRAVNRKALSRLLDDYDGVGRGREWRKIRPLLQELDVEMDGVRVPASAAAVLNALRSILAKTSDE